MRLNGLLQFNLERTGGKLSVPDREIVHVARDGYGAIVGGISGSTYLSSFEVEVLWVQERYRELGIASRLLKAAEDEAREAGCTLSHLTTYSFQAPLFYRKNGYSSCGEVDGFPDGIKLFLFKKQL